MSLNVFAEEWLECLRAHYMHVIRTEDHVTLPSLTIVMRQAGFDDSQLAELRVRATMRAEDVSPDFVPDLDVLNHAESEQSEATIFPVPEIPTPVEAVAPAAEAAALIETAPEVQVLEAIVEAEAVLPENPLTEDLEAELLSGEVEVEPETDVEEDEPEKEDPNAPQQLTLF